MIKKKLKKLKLDLFSLHLQKKKSIHRSLCFTRAQREHNQDSDINSSNNSLSG